MDRLEAAIAVRELRESADCYVRAYAQLHASHVSPRYLEAICGALGDISIEEAINGLAMLELEEQERFARGLMARKGFL